MIRFFSPNFLCQSNFFISLCAGSLSFYLGFKTQGNFSLFSPLIAFLGTFISYHLLRMIPFLRNETVENSFSSYYKTYLKPTVLLLIIASVLMVYLLAGLNFFQITLVVHLFLIVLLYEKILFKTFELRKFPFLKPFIISYVWAAMGLGLHYSSLDQLDFKLFIDIFVFIFFLSVPFDIKDSEYDRSQGLTSFVHLFRSKVFFSFVLFVGYSLYCYWSFHFVKEEIFLIVSPLLFGFLSYLMNKTHHQYLFYFGFDGLIVLRALFLLNS